MPNSISVQHDSFASSTSYSSEIDYVQNIKAMLEKSSSQISRNGNSQLQRLINNIDNPEKSKPMKAVSLGELNTADLHFIIVAILERRMVTCEEQNDALKRSLKKALRRIDELEHFIGSMKESNESLKILTHSKSTIS